MRSFKNLITEQKETIVFTFGRFNPPTIGHEKLIQKVASVAGSNPFRIYPSHTTNPKKDPLPHALKVAYMRKMFKKYSKNIIADKKMKTAIFIAEALYKEGFKNLIMVVGSDRVQEFSTLLNRYNDAPDKKGNQLFKFDSVKVLSAGERDPDAEGIEGMSASKMRAAAADGDKDAFLTGFPSNFKDGEKLYRDVRKHMGIREERDMGDMTDFETVRDMYLTGKIWNAGDIVEANGYTGEVVRKGTNYLTFSDEDGKVHKVWLHEITLDEAKSPLQKLKDFDKVRTGLGKKPIFKDKKKKEEAKFDEGIRASRPRAGGGREGKNIEQNLAVHYKLMQDYIKQGMSKEKASKVAFDDVEKMKPKEFKKILASLKEEIELDEESSVYKKTATKAKNKEGTIYAFGRDKKLDGQPTEKGGYIVWKLEKRYAGHVRGGIAQNWAYVKKDLSYSDAVKLMNKRLKYKGFNEEVELDERNYRKEYDNYQGRPEQIARRSSRNQARRILGDKTKIGMDVGHKDNNPLNNDPKNLKNENPSKNRREPRLREKEEVDETMLPWMNTLKDYLHQKIHPKGYSRLGMEYAKEIVKLQKAGKNPNKIEIIHQIAAPYDGVTDKNLRDFINGLVKKGKIPQELKAEFEPQNKTMSFKSFVNQIQTNEVLSKDADAGEYIKDFKKSDAPQFKGKSEKKKKQMGIAAYYSTKK